MVSKLLLVSLICLSMAGPNLEKRSTLEDTDGTWTYLGLSGYSGMVTMNALTGSSLFYWLFEAIGGNITTDSAPLILWLQGGPGCSGETGMLFENISPLSIYSNAARAFATDLNYTWATDFHIITVDFPYGAGYSFANTDGDNKNSTQAATYYLYRLLLKLNSKYPTWFKRSFYIFGESYGGHWIPGLAWNILQYSQLNGFNISLKGIAMGDPWIDPPTQSQTYGTYALTTSLINNNQYSIVNYYQSSITTYLKQQMYLQAEAFWENSYGTIVDFSQGINVYNVRNYVNYNIGYVSKWLNQPGTKTIFHVPSYASWTQCNDTVYDYYRADIMNSTLPYVNYILSQGVQVMIYNGQDDLIVNAIGIENMIATMNIANFTQAPKMNWFVNNTLAGYVQTASNFTFVLVLKAGHLAPYDQPVNIKDMVLRFVYGQAWDE